MQEAFELISIAARYWFLLLAVLAAIGAIKGVSGDWNRQKKKNKQNIGAFCGEFCVVSGSGRRLSLGDRYPFRMEGLIGSSRDCDINLVHESVPPKYATFHMLENGLLIQLVKSYQNAQHNGQPYEKTALLLDGDTLSIGEVVLQCTLYDIEFDDSRDGTSTNLRWLLPEDETRTNQNGDDISYRGPSRDDGGESDSYTDYYIYDEDDKYDEEDEYEDYGYHDD